MIQGIIDLYFEDEQGLVLVDYKTDRLFGPEAALIMKQRYSTQLKLYAEALKRLTGKTPEAAWLYAAHLNQWIDIELTGKEKEAAF
jgi:ATP-dependent helicase/nuclease subunit A